MPTIEEAVVQARAGAEKRKFAQSFDLAVNLKQIDMKKPESKFSKEILLPHGTGHTRSVCLIADGAEYENRIGRADLQIFAKDKKKAKTFVAGFDFFIAEAPLMVEVGKVLGRYLGPIGRMPRLLPPGHSPKKLAEEMQNVVRVRVKDSPSLHCTVGKESMSDAQIKENVAKVLEEVKKVLPGKAQIRNAYLKLTMGKSVKIDVKN